MREPEPEDSVPVRTMFWMPTPVEEEVDVEAMRRRTEEAPAAEVNVVEEVKKEEISNEAADQLAE